MKYLLSIVGLFLSFVGSVAQTDTSRTKADNPAKIVKETSYAYGYNFASDLTTNENFDKAERSTSAVLKGLKAGMKPDSAQLAAIVEGLIKRIDSEERSKTPKEAQKTAYNLGYNALGNLVSLLELEKKDLHYSCIKKGYTDFVNGKTPKVSEKKQTQLLAIFFQEKQALAEEKALERRKSQAVENLSIAEAFLAKNGKKETIKTTQSGLQYEVLEEGTGGQPSINNRVLVHYTGTLINGKVFDDSRTQEKPVAFDLTAVIKGWREGIPLMRVGARYRFFIPPGLAYGAGGPYSIPPNSLLIFDVELIDIFKETGPETAISKLSYAYGHMVGTALLDLNFTANETNVEQFVQGFSKGFKADPATIQAVENRIKARMASGKSSIDKEVAFQIANGIGYTPSAGLVQAANALPKDFDYQALGEGYEIGLQQKDPLYNPEEMAKVLEAYATSKKNNAESVPDVANESERSENIKRGNIFLQENGKKEGIITRPSGLQYKVIKEGTGAQPTLNSTVTTHYVGQLIDGTVFDSSVKRGQPASFPLKAVIKGWQEGIPLMKKGGKYRFFIPANLAYGNRAMGTIIPAGSTLIFEVELLEVE